MSKLHFVFILATAFSNQFAWADNVPSTTNPYCEKIANACLSAGFERTEKSGKQIWQSCMKPVLLNQSVNGVNIKAGTIKECREYKIKELTSELKELESALQ